MPVIPRPPHVISNVQLPLENSIVEISPLNIELVSYDSKLSENSDFGTAAEPVPMYIVGNLDSTISTSIPNETDFLSSLSHEQLLLLTQEMCKDRKVRIKLRKTHNSLFSTVSSPKPKKQRTCDLSNQVTGIMLLIYYLVLVK